ncbi:MAG: protoporphyrinogen oxidase [Acidimicrobiia bacterium]
MAIIGGGLAGLFTAIELIEHGIDDVVVFDEGSLPGGVARTIQRDGYSLEPAAGTLMLPNPHLTPLLQHIGVTVTPAPDAGIRYVYTRGRLVGLPSSPKAALSPLVSWSAKVRAAAEPFIRRPAEPDSDESLDSFLRRRFGQGLAGTLAWVAASGVFAGDPTRLAARSAFPALPGLEDAAGSVVRGGVARMRQRSPGAIRPSGHVPKGGMTALADAAAARLGDRYRPGTPVAGVTSGTIGWKVECPDTVTAQHLVVASRPSAAAGLVDDTLAGVLRQATTAPAVVLGLGGPAAGFPLPAGFGALTGPDAATATLGVLFESSYAPARSPEGHSFVKVIAGGATRPHVVDWDDDRLVTTIGDEVSRILGRTIEASFVEVVRHHHGIPQYNVGHRSWLERLDGLLMDRPGLHLTGWGYRGVGVAHIAADATAVARRIAG